jgi:hypothetical protein
MSRGPGRVQRFILDTLAESGVDGIESRVWPVPAIAHLFAVKNGVPDTPHVRSAFRRAAAALVRTGSVYACEIPLATRTDRHMNGMSRRLVQCVALPGPTEVTRGDVDDAEMRMRLSEAQLSSTSSSTTGA